MSIVSRRVAAGLALALPAALSPVSALASQVQQAPQTPSQVGTSAPGLTGQAPAAPKPGVWRWRDYVTQKPVWSTKTCSPATLATTKSSLPKSSGLKVECAVVRTPLSWSDLSKGSLELGITRVVRTTRTAPKTTASKTASPKAGAANASTAIPAPKTPVTPRLLMLNPGGPGGSAGQMVPAMAALKPKLLATHQLVGVDPRGTGLSHALQCQPPQLTLPVFDANNTKHQAATQRALKTFVQNCVKQQGRYLPHITTVNTVHDMDLARRLLGYPKADWYGLSAGTWMGAWYAQLHPSTIGRVVLDANTEFTTDWRNSFRDFPMGIQRRWDQQFLPWAARANKTYRLGSTAATVRATYAKIHKAAAAGKITGFPPTMLDTLSLLMMYDDRTFPVWAGALSSVNTQLTKSGKATLPLPPEVLAAFADTDTSTLTVRTAILCNDTPYPRTPASYIKESQEHAKKAPLVAYTFLGIMGPCAYWPYKPGPAPKIDGTGVPTMLMVQNELDPATPLETARRAHAAHSATRMLFVDNAGSHGAYMSENTCVDEKVTGFLATGTLPATDVTCQGLPLPGEKRVYEVTAG